MKKILFVFGSGGHSAQALKILNELKDSHQITLLTEKDDPLSAKKLKAYKFFTATAFRGKRENFISTVCRALVCSIDTFKVMVRVKPDVILSTGPGIAIPAAYLGKLFGKKVIFIESWSRVTTKSFAGRLIYPIANQFYVQWPEMKKAYPKAIFAGRLG